MQPAIDADGYQRGTILEGSAPFLVAKNTDEFGVIVVKADISTIKATIVNITLGNETVLDESALAKATVWFDTYQTFVDRDGDTVTYNFGWQTTSTWFQATAADTDCQFKVEVWVTRVIGEPFSAGAWLLTSKKSIVPIPA